jgi:hypothetical protein
MEVPQETDPSLPTSPQSVCQNQGRLARQWHFCVDGNFPHAPRHSCFYSEQAPCPWAQDVPLGFKDDSTDAATDYITSINDSASQLSRMQPMTVQDVHANVTLMGLYLSEASCHQKAYKELLALTTATRSRLTKCKTRSSGSLVLEQRVLSRSPTQETLWHAPTAALAAAPFPVATRRTVLRARLPAQAARALIAPSAQFTTTSIGTT